MVRSTITLELIAESEEQVRLIVDEKCSSEWRDRPYKGVNNPYQDTLKVKILEENITLPYILREY